MADILRALRYGPEPRAVGSTIENEQVLGIVEPCVYAYLGHSNIDFGDCAFCLQSSAFDGGTARVSPFDTGGLVRYHAPVNAWPDGDRRIFLERYSWVAAQLPGLLELYPTRAPERVAAYLDGDRPPAAGPHEVFPPPPESDEHIAAIWSNGSDPRAWLWEARVERRLPSDQLLKWSCSSATYQAILEYAYTLGDGEEADWLASLLERYVKGGPSILTASLRRLQEAA